MPGMLFISYRRTHQVAVDAVSALLVAHGVTVWLDRRDIAALDDFPDRIREGIAHSHAVLVWWSSDYADSDICLQEFRLAWQLARSHPDDEGPRIWILNPETSGVSHIHAGDLGSQSFLSPPLPDNMVAWAVARHAALTTLARFGTLAADYSAATAPVWHGGPTGGPAFVGRGSELMRMHSVMFPTTLNGNMSPITLQLHGIAGVGKSALSASYAKAFGAAYPGGIWWFNLSAKSESAFDSVDDAGMVWLWALGEALGLRPGLLAEVSRDDDGCALPPPQVRERLSRYLSAGDKPKPYLWVLDKLPAVQRRDIREKIISFLCAPTHAGRTLITCHDALPSAGATAIMVPPLPAADGQKLLGCYLAPAQRQQERQVIGELVAEVGGHPLALMLLGESVKDSPWGLTPVLEQVRELGALASMEQIQCELSSVLGALAPSVTAAIQVSLKPLGDAHRRLLALASVCARNTRIPMRLLERAFHVPEHGGGQVGAGNGFKNALAALHGASLLSLDLHDRQHATVHSLVAAVLLQSLGRPPKPEQQAIAEALLARLSRLDSDASAFVDLRADAPHVLTLLAAHDSAQPSPIDDHAAVLLARRLALLHDASGHPDRALAAASQAVALAARRLAADDPDYLRAQIALASAKAATGALDAAVKLLQTLLPAAQRVFGATDDDALVVSNLLATTRYQQHRFDEAEQLQRTLLDAVRDLPDDRYAVKLAALSGLAATLHQQNHLPEAHELQERALALAERMAPAGHPDTVVALHNLAATRLAQGEIDQAIMLLRRALLQAETVLGTDHPTTRLTRSALADALVGHQAYEEAITLYQQAMADATRELGADHPESLVVLSRLIGATDAFGRHQDADALEKILVATAAPVLPAGHPDALAAIESLANDLHLRGRPIGHLAPLFDQVLQARLRDLGEGHEETIHAFSNLALASAQAGAIEAAVSLRWRALQATRELPSDAPRRNALMQHAHMELILLLDQLGQHTAARQAEIEAGVDLLPFFRSLLLH